MNYSDKEGMNNINNIISIDNMKTNGNSNDKENNVIKNNKDLTWIIKSIFK